MIRNKSQRHPTRTVKDGGVKAGYLDARDNIGTMKMDRKVVSRSWVSHPKEYL
jgi:hypothetical protein